MTFAFLGAVSAVLAFFGERFVDLAVAVVILAVAAFGLGSGLADTSLPFSGLTLLFSRAADAFVCGVCGAIVTFAGFACGASTRRAIGDAVAIIVDLVAAIFGFGLIAAFAGKLAVLALGDAAFAGAFGVGDVADLAVFGERFVDFAVTVVVFAVADFDLWGDFVFARCIPKPPTQVLMPVLHSPMPMVLTGPL